MMREIEFLINKSKRSLDAAKRLSKEGDHDFAVSRAYYSIFYLSEALLLKKGQSFSKHGAVIAAVYDLYIKTNELPKEFHKILHRAFDLRQQGDYMGYVQITADVANDLIHEIEKQMKIALTKLEDA